MSTELHETFDLPGGQARVREAVLYVSWECRNATRFGQTKLHKILWRADFKSFAERGIPVTGRRYQRLKQGPCLQEMLPLQKTLIEKGAIALHRVDLGGGFMEERVVPAGRPEPEHLSERDLYFLDEAVLHYWDKTARETSDEAHGVAWSTHGDKQVLPYELALLSDEPPSDDQTRRLEILGHLRRWQTA